MLLKNNSCKKQLFNLTIVDRSAKTTEIIDVREIKFFLIILKIMEKLYRKIQSKSSMTQSYTNIKTSKTVVFGVFC